MEPDSFKLGVQAARAGDYKTAQTYFIQVVKANPNSEKGWLYLGHCLAEPELRKECYQKVLKLNPYNPDAHKALSSLNQPNLSQKMNPYAEVRRPAPQPPAAIAKPAPPVSAVKSKKRSRAITLVLSGCGVSLILCLGLFFVVALMPKNSSSQALSSQTPPTPTTQSTTPDLDAAALPAPAASTGAGKVCLGFERQGVACLDERGWQTYTKDNSELPDTFINAGDICPDGSLAIAHNDGFSLVHDQQWEQLPLLGEGFGIATDLACDKDNHIWATHLKGVSRYVDGAWQTFGKDLLMRDATGNDELHVIAAPDGAIWVQTPRSVARFANEAWTIFQPSQGFTGDPTFTAITLDATGRPWVGYINGIAVYDNGNWRQFASGDPKIPHKISLDARGWFWMSIYSEGLTIFDGQTWTTYSQKTQSLPSNTINALAADTLGRVWVGTANGLSVFDGSQWLTYTMDNSDLLDQQISFVALEKDGPTLPPLVEKPKGSVAGQFPLRYKHVELCAELVLGTFTGETPCAKRQAFHMVTTTDESGNFVFENVPPGSYYIYAETNQGWAKLTEDYSSTPRIIQVKPGERYDLGKLEISR